MLHRQSNEGCGSWGCGKHQQQLSSGILFVKLWCWRYKRWVRLQRELTLAAYVRTASYTVENIRERTVILRAADALLRQLEAGTHTSGKPTPGKTSVHRQADAGKWRTVYGKAGVAGKACAAQHHWVAYIIMQPRRYCVVSKERLTQMLWPWPLTFYLLIYYHARWQPDIQLYKHDTAIQKFLKNIKQHRNNEITSPQTWQMNSKSVL